MPLIPFPDVPPFPGVPALAAAATFIPGAGLALSAITLLTGDDPEALGLVAAPQWGIFFSDNGDVAIEVDSVIGFEHAKEFRISTYPVEEGSFESYNKVELPYNERIVLAKGGSDDARSQFIDTLDDLIESLDLFTIITPNKTYVNANLVRVSYARHAQQGATLITAEVQIEEVRVAGDSTFSNTANPAGVSAVSGGTVQTQTPTAAQASAVDLEGLF